MAGSTTTRKRTTTRTKKADDGGRKSRRESFKYMTLDDMTRVRTLEQQRGNLEAEHYGMAVRQDFFQDKLDADPDGPNAEGLQSAIDNLDTQLDGHEEMIGALNTELLELQENIAKENSTDG